MSKLVLYFIKNVAIFAVDLIDDIDLVIAIDILSNRASNLITIDENIFDFAKSTFISSSITMFDWENFEFTKQQWNILQTLLERNNILEFSSSQESSDLVVVVSNRWNAAEIEFFDLHYDDKIATTVSTIEHVDKNIYFRDVHVFIKRVKNMTTIKSAEMMRKNLYFCLRNVALEWYTFILSEK